MLTVKQAAEKANVHIETIRVWIREGILPASIMARKKGYRIREEDLEEVLKNKNEIKQKGKVEAKKVLDSIVRAWQVSGDKNYFKIAYEVAEIADILKDYQREWDKWDGNIVGKENELLEKRMFHINHKGKEKQKEVEGNLILLSLLEYQDD